MKLLSPAVRFFGTPRGRGTGFSLMSLGNLLAAVLMYVRQAEIARILPFDYSAATPTRLLILVAYSAAGFGIFAAGSLALRSPAMLKLERSAGERLRRLAGR